MTQAARPAGRSRWPGVPFHTGLSLCFLTTRPTISRPMSLLLSAYLAAVRPSDRSC
jgi:hypothetical protein